MINSNEIRQKGYFLRLFCNTIDDPALAKLEDKVFRFYVYLQLIAKEGASNGRVDNSLTEISWRIRWHKRAVERCMNSLIEHGFVTRLNEGFSITNWNESQYSDSYVRVKRFRNRKKQESCNAVCNGFVTIETEREIEKETERDGEAEGNCVTHTETDNIANAGNETGLEKQTETEVEEACLNRVADFETPFEDPKGEPKPDAVTGYPSQYLFRRFQEEFPLCPWTPENVMDVIRSRILASKLWTVQEVEFAIRRLASKTPGKNANPKQLIAALQNMTRSGETQSAIEARRAKQIAQKKEEERILRENEEWQKIHGKRQPGQALREIRALVEASENKTGNMKDTIHDDTDMRDDVIVKKQVQHYEMDKR